MSRRCSAYFAFFFFVVLLLCPASGQTASLSETAEQAVNCGVPAASVASVESLVGKGVANDAQAVSLLSLLLEACVEQLPVSPLADKLAEGVAKRVPPPFIARALKKRLDGYRLARTLLLTRAGSLDPEALTVVGMGVDEGVPSKDFETYVAEFGKQPQDMFLTGLMMVSLQGQAAFDFNRTRRIIEQGITSESLNDGWRYFVRVILAARKRGISDEAVTEGAVAVLGKGGVVSDVMEELGFTSRDLGYDEESK